MQVPTNPSRSNRSARACPMPSSAYQARVATPVHSSCGARARVMVRSALIADQRPQIEVVPRVRGEVRRPCETHHRRRLLARDHRLRGAVPGRGGVGRSAFPHLGGVDEPVQVVRSALVHTRGSPRRRHDGRQARIRGRVGTDTQPEPQCGRVRHLDAVRVVHGGDHDLKTLALPCDLGAKLEAAERHAPVHVDRDARDPHRHQRRHPFHGPREERGRRPSVLAVRVPRSLGEHRRNDEAVTVGHEHRFHGAFTS